jgi:methylisocitrate lyase
MPTIDPRVEAFRRLHESGCFVVPNPWDVGSAKLLEQLGFPAIATSSAGFAWTLGRADNGVTVDEALAHLAAISGAVRIPVNADFERGFATEPEEVALNVTRACETGIAGLSIEDSTRDAEHPLFDLDVAVARMRAARRAIDETGTGVILVGRSEGFISGRPDLRETIRRLLAYAEAGADCLFAPGLPSIGDVAEVVRGRAEAGERGRDVRSLHRLAARRRRRAATQHRRLAHARRPHGVPRRGARDRGARDLLRLRRRDVDGRDEQVVRRVAGRRGVGPA